MRTRSHTCTTTSAHRNSTVPPQEQGLDTVDANRALGLPDDCREYTSVRNMLKDLDVKSIRLVVSLRPCTAGVCRQRRQGSCTHP